jgi:hypothetical protein
MATSGEFVTDGRTVHFTLRYGPSSFVEKDGEQKYNYNIEVADPEDGAYICAMYSRPVDDEGMNNFARELGKAYYTESRDPLNQAWPVPTFPFATQYDASQQAAFEIQRGGILGGCLWAQQFGPDTKLNIELAGGTDADMYRAQVVNDDNRVLGEQVGSADGGHNDTYYAAANLKPSLKEAYAYDPQNRLKEVETTNDDGSSKDTKFDPENTHPYDKLEISEGADGKPTNVQFNLDKDTATRSTNGSVADLGVIGQVFGSSIGRILAPDNQFGHLLGGTVGGLIGQKLAPNFAASLTFDGSKGTNADFTTFSGLDVASAAAGSVASFLIAEIGTKLGLQGYGAQLFNSGAGAFTGSILNTVIQHGGLQVLAQEATWATAFATAEGAVGGTLGGILAQNLVHAESKQGAVGGQLLGAVGSALGMSFVALQAITGILGFVIPGVGSFFGTILGTMLGDAIAGDPGAPKAVHDVQILGSDTHFTNRLVGTDDHGNAEVSRKMSAEVVTIANNFLDAIHGAGISYPGKVMIGYNDGSGPYDYITGWFPNGTEATPRFTDPNDAIQEGVRELLMQTGVIGGDLLLKRTQQAFIAGSHSNRNRGAKARRPVRATGWRRGQGSTAGMACIHKAA